MPPKRSYTKNKTAKKYGVSTKKANASARVLQSAIKRVLNRNIETKRSNSSSSDNVSIPHNSFINVDSAVLSTTQGVQDPSVGVGLNRIGDEINLKGVAFKFMLENDHRFSDTTFRIMVIKSAKGDTPTSATLFNGLSGNKMMDTFNSERYTLLFQKYVKVKQGNAGGDGALGATYAGSGLFDGDASQTISASTKIVKFYISGEKFCRNGLVRYENGSSQVKFYDYNVLIYAYGVGSTSEALAWNVGKMNEYIKVVYYKDA